MNKIHRFGTVAVAAATVLGGITLGTGAAAAAPTSVPGTGFYIVGVDIEPGTYTSYSDDNCYWERLSGASGELRDIISNDFRPGASRTMVTISAYDRYFSSQSCGAWTMVVAPTPPPPPPAPAAPAPLPPPPAPPAPDLAAIVAPYVAPLAVLGLVGGMGSAAVGSAMAPMLLAGSAGI